MALLSERACAASRQDRYARRQPELTALHRTLSAHWPAFVEQAEQAGGLPRFVLREVQEYLDCGILERGCAELVCDRCVKQPWADGTSAFVLQPLDFIARIVAAIPPPRFHLTRFHGVLSSHSTLRPLVIPKPAPLVPVAPLQLLLFPQPTSTTHAPAGDAEPTAPRQQGRHPWAQLLRHVFAADVSACVACQGRMTRFVIPEGVRLRELCTTPSAIARAMARAGHAPQAPPAPPRALRVHPTQLRLALS